MSNGIDIDVTNPGRLDEIVGTVSGSSSSDVGEAIGAAAEAQRIWSASTVPERVAALYRIADAIDAHADELATLISREQGSVRAVTAGEAKGTAQAFRDAAEPLPEVWAPVERSDGEGRIRIERRPLGVVAGIVPWNAPAVLAANKIAPAVATGNGIVVKPSPLAPLAVTLLVRIVAEHLPSGLVQVVHGGSEPGDALIGDPRIRKVSFTGGAETAKLIMRRAAETITDVHLELGGNDPALVLDDADLDGAADAIVDAALRRSGQVCYAIKRVYVPRAHLAYFVERATAHAERIIVGDAFDPAATMGPVISDESAERLSALLDRARALGRDVRVVGSVSDPSAFAAGAYVRPAVVVGAAPEDELVLGEQFGPILPIVAYDDEDDVIRWANGTDFGLCASVWSSDSARAMNVASRIEAGTTFVNQHGYSRAGVRDIPFGGVKQSGIGWERAGAGLAEYTTYHSYDVANAEGEAG